MSIMFRSKRTRKKPTLLKTLVSGQLLAEQWWPEPDSLLMVSRKPKSETSENSTVPCDMRQTIPKSLNCWKKVLLLSLTEIKFHKHYHVISEECMGSRSRQGVLPWSKNDKHLGTVKKGGQNWFCTLRKPCAAISQKNFHAQQHELDEQSERKDNVSTCLNHVWNIFEHQK